MNYTNPSSVGMSRLKKVLINDKHFDPARLNAIIASDVYQVLNNYFEVRPEDIGVQIAFDDKGEYVIRIKAFSNRVKVLGILPDVG